ncbi:MAG TPA: hypothetical protein EYP06_09700 [Desulfobacterales bacterium]|nr:hypothetical protein [Desulfobacterales bacterium]
MLDVGVEYGVITKKGHSYSYKEERLGVGREKAKTALKTDAKIMDAISKDVHKAVKEALTKDE